MTDSSLNLSAFPPDVQLALLPAVMAVAAQASGAMRHKLYGKVDRAGKVAVRANGDRYSGGFKHIMTAVFPNGPGPATQPVPGPMDTTSLPAPFGNDNGDQGDEDDERTCECSQCNNQTCDGDCDECEDYDCSQCWPNGEPPCENGRDCCGWCRDCDTHHDIDYHSDDHCSGCDHCRECDHYCDDV